MQARPSDSKQQSDLAHAREPKYGRAMAQGLRLAKLCISACIRPLLADGIMPLPCAAGIHPVKLCARMLVMPGGIRLLKNGCWWHADVHYVQPGLPPVHPRTPTSAGRQHSTENEGSSPSFSASGPMHAGHRFSSSSNKVTCLSCVLLTQDPPHVAPLTIIWDIAA